MKNSKSHFVLFSIMLCFTLSGCSIQDKTSEISINVKDAIELDFSNVAEMDLCKEIAELPSSYIDEKTKDEVNTEQYGINSKSIYNINLYYESMSQFSYQAELYCYDRVNQSRKMIYRSESVTNMNELEVNEDYVTWIEYIPDGDYIDYNFMVLDCDTNQIENIGVLSSQQFDEVCLSISDQYLTWYETKTDSTKTRIGMYDFKTKKTDYIEDSHMTLYYPYRCARISDQGFTYFTEEDETIYVNRYNLNTKKRYRINIGSENYLVDCFSSEDYIGWYTDYNRGTYYIYDRNENILYKYHNSINLTIMDKNISDKFYFTASGTPNLYCYDFKTATTYVDELETQPSWFIRTENDNMYFYTNGVRYYMMEILPQ